MKLLSDAKQPYQIKAADVVVHGFFAFFSSIEPIADRAFTGRQ